MFWLKSHSTADLLSGWTNVRSQRGQAAASLGKQTAAVRAFLDFAAERGVLRAGDLSPELVRLYAAHLARPPAAAADGSAPRPRPLPRSARSSPRARQCGA